MSAKSKFMSLYHVFLNQKLKLESQYEVNLELFMNQIAKSSLVTKANIQFKKFLNLFVALSSPYRIHQPQSPLYLCGSVSATIKETA